MSCGICRSDMWQWQQEEECCPPTYSQFALPLWDDTMGNQTPLRGFGDFDLDELDFGDEVEKGVEEANEASRVKRHRVLNFFLMMMVPQPSMSICPLKFRRTRHQQKYAHKIYSQISRVRIHSGRYFVPVSCRQSILINISSRIVQISDTTKDVALDVVEDAVVQSPELEFEPLVDDKEATITTPDYKVWAVMCQSDLLKKSANCCWNSLQAA
ncbi:uncharacterized protein LOC122033832 [Zingiber officinale]|uniref:uncharacterized protein LOC122033832 n=1 Tax=Zingiber officinale TaxID=94328 RepID=UPI001C4CB79B|nr:uncharacterized protein LOC122033832 [Zingiber officinale]